MKAQFWVSGFCMIIFSILLIRCENPLSEEDFFSELATLDLSNATAVYLAPETGEGLAKADARSATVRTNRLFKITASGVVQEVEYLTEDDEVIEQSLSANHLYAAGDDFLIISFSETPGPEYIDDSYLVRKSDGAVFLLDYNETGIFPLGYPAAAAFANYGVVQTDGEGSLYFKNFWPEHRIYRVTTGGGNFTSEPLSPAYIMVGKFLVDRNGNLAMGEGMDGYLLASDGSLANLPSTEMWIAADGKLYLTYYHDESNTHSILRVRSAGASSVNYDTVATGLESVPFLLHGPNFLLNIAERTLIATNAGVWEVYNPSGLFREISGVSTRFSEITAADASENVYYLAGNGPDAGPLLLRVDPETNAVTTLSTAYNIKVMEVTPDNRIYFSGLRMSDATYVVGIMGAGGGVTILDEGLSESAYALERIQ